MNRKIKASTLVETLVALTIIMLSFGFALLIFSQVLNAGKVSRQTRAYITINDLNLNKRRDTASGAASEMTFIRNVIPYAQDTSLRLLTIEAQLKNGEHVFTHREIILPDTTE